MKQHPRVAQGQPNAGRFTKPLKGLLATILQDKDGTNCSNGGISARCNRVVIVGPGIDEVFEADDNTPAVQFVKRDISGVCVHLEPVAPLGIDEAESQKSGKPVQNCGWQHGGCYVSLSDSRLCRAVEKLGYPSLCAIALFDRQDSWADNEVLSR